MHWKPQIIALDKINLDARRTEVMTGEAANRAYEQLLRSEPLAGDQMFIRRYPISLRPADPSNPEFGCVSDDDPDRHEIWRIPNCSLSDAIRIAVHVFDAPSLSVCLASTFNRTEMMNFIQTLPDWHLLTLKFVCEDFLKFRYREVPSGFDRKSLNRIIEFKLKMFSYEHEESEEKWQWEAFTDHQTFTIGAV